MRKAKNVLEEVRKKDWKVVAEDLRRVFYAGGALAAKQALEAFDSCKLKPFAGVFTGS